MRGTSFLVAIALLVVQAPAVALERSLEASLLRLDPETRFHQLCDIETMRRISAANGALHPDRMVMDAEREAELSGDEIIGRGAAIRSGGRWYRLTFRCRATSDRLTVLELNYRIGAAIPESRWDEIGLWR
ncbi:DUF930 domain-containing protein [Chenggangzhangella methanolivorans]|uniref:DUF930 domain-containing protein n=1 Tax=Chenggangzhangella methanolivorans TaxID=1437009 RepID=A0A9E6RD30_9HYPH|nr:DUF930 domain-containing protein [Chenggangzhangella methanolivorans]QZO01074.1 DUF930 domain-containing protein [Chenggangzhangella methanolivorans]